MRKKRVVVIICLLLIVAIAAVIAWQFLHVDSPAVGDGLEDDNQSDVVDPVPVVPHEHSWSEWIVKSLPTCVDMGQEQRVCDCGEIQCRDLAALGHSFGVWGLLLHPTCVDGGYEQRDCLVCGQPEMREVPALGHDYIDGYCTRCGEIDPNYDFSCKHENTSGLILDPTCTEDGYVNVSCSDCGSLLSSETIPATGHTFGEWTTFVSSTCTTDGEQIRGCACGATESQSIPALGHDYVDGYCTRCGASDEIYFNNFVGYWFTDSTGFDSEEFDCYYFLIEKDEKIDGKYYFTRSGYKIEDGVVILYNNPTDYGSLQSFTYSSVDGIKQFTLTRWEQSVDCSYDGQHLYVGSMLFYKTNKSILYDGTTTPVTPLQYLLICALVETH